MAKNLVIPLTGLVLTIVFGAIPLKAQRFSVETLVFLPEVVHESSGIIYLNDKIVTHNDGGGEAVLYEIDPETGELSAELVVSNSTNQDWEELTFDQQHIYIADIGNNDGERTDLRFYQINLISYFQRTNNMLSADTIRFSYENQLSFDADPRTNFDAGAVISYGDSLYIFTRNWGDLHSNIYSLPKIPGDHIAKQIGRINPEGLITGAVYNPYVNEIMLTGYTFNGPFLFRLWDFEGPDFSQAKTKKLSFELPGSFQIEGIEAIDETEYLITSESNDLGDAMLFKVDTDFVVGLPGLKQQELVIFPNPAQDYVSFRGLNEKVKQVVLTDVLGVKISALNLISSSERLMQLNISALPNGLYHLRIETAQNQYLHRLLIDHGGN